MEIDYETSRAGKTPRTVLRCEEAKVFLVHCIDGNREEMLIPCFVALNPKAPVLVPQVDTTSRGRVATILDAAPQWLEKKVREKLLPEK